MKKKTAVILFNLGGPENLSSVKNFLFNLFYDPAIIRLPNPFRWLLAKFISKSREKLAKEIYTLIGGGSPILAITKKQANLLEEKLNSQRQGEFKVFVSMRYAAPRASEVIAKIEEFSPNKITCLPLYPQYSTTTTKSSFDEFIELLKESSLNKVELQLINNYHQDKAFIKAHVELIKETILKTKGKFRILFSAHGLPEYIIKNGDPYQKQIEETVKLIMKELDQLDYVICYQSKVGRLKWLEPSTEAEIIRAAEDDLSVIIVPIAFVSDHSETLVELDIEYKKLYQEKSKNAYLRVPALNENQNFIQCLFNQIDL